MYLVERIHPRTHSAQLYPFSTHPSLHPSLCSQGKFLRLRLVQFICLWWAMLGSGAYTISYKQETEACHVTKAYPQPPPSPRTDPFSEGLGWGLVPGGGSMPPTPGQQPAAGWSLWTLAGRGKGTLDCHIRWEHMCLKPWRAGQTCPNHFPPQHQSCWYCCCIWKVTSDWGPVSRCLPQQMINICKLKCVLLAQVWWIWLLATHLSDEKTDEPLNRAFWNHMGFKLNWYYCDASILNI